MIRLILIICTFIFAYDANHLLLIQVVTQPTAGESISIYNPTDTPINLNDYYISDDKEYYKMQTEGDMAPSHFINGFTARFPNINIDPNDTLIIVLNFAYSDYYGEDFFPNLAMYLDQDNSMIESIEGSFGKASSDIDGDPETTDDINPVAKLNDAAELIILYYWDGDPNIPVKDVDYFLWGDTNNAINKTELSGYNNDTSEENQLYFEEEADENYSYSRINIDEIDETNTGGNGINEHDETSENFRASWEIKEIFKLGCTDSDAPNYNATAEKDDESCFIPFEDVTNGLFDCSASSNGYCDSNPTCPVVRLRGLIVDYFDVTVYGGPHAITIEDEDGFRVEATIWPSEWNIASDDASNYLITPPYNRFLVEAQGSVFEYDGEKQVLICTPSDFFVIESFDQEGFFTANNSAIVQISPAPFVLLPSMGETLDFSYSFPKNSRVIIRLLDLSGRFITSLVDKFYANAGSVSRIEDSSAWDGRDYLGQIVAPGTYIMHIEAMNPKTGKTYTDAAPVVVGVKN